MRLFHLRIFHLKLFHLRHIPLRPIRVRPRSLETTTLDTSSFVTTFTWDHFIWDHIHLRPTHLRPHSFETTFVWDHIHFTSQLFYAALKWSCFNLPWITFLWSTFHFFAGDLKFCKVSLHLEFCKLTTFRVKGDPSWVVEALALPNTAEAWKHFIIRVWKRAFYLWNGILLDQVSDLCALSSCRFLHRGATIFQVFDW